MPRMAEHVIELDGATTYLVRYGTDSGVLELDPMTGVHGSVQLSDCTGRVGAMKLEPDPVAAAVLAERERFDAAASTVLSCEQYSRLQDAIERNAPPAEVSEYDKGYVRGATHTRDLSAQIAYDKRLVAIDTGKHPPATACRDIEYAIRAISTEPTP